MCIRDSCQTCDASTGSWKPPSDCVEIFASCDTFQERPNFCTVSKTSLTRPSSPNSKGSTKLRPIPIEIPAALDRVSNAAANPIAAYGIDATIQRTVPMATTSQKSEGSEVVVSVSCEVTHDNTSDPTMPAITIITVYITTTNHFAESRPDRDVALATSGRNVFQLNSLPIRLDVTITVRIPPKNPNICMPFSKILATMIDSRMST